MKFITETTRECNTFKIYVTKEEDHKTVSIEIHTDFTGTILEEDFPDGDTSTCAMRVSKSLTDKEAGNLVGSRIIENWVNI